MRRTFLLFILSFILIMTGCSKGSSVYSTPGNSYAEINCIDDLSFYIPFSVTNQATAVTQIVDGMGYDSNSIYSFNNGSDTYIMFCMDQLIVIAEKGTTFHFANASNKGDCLNNSAVINTWFKPAGKSFSFTDDTSNNIYKLIAPVTAEVVITSELYGDYVGKLAVIDYADEEWSLFVGVIAESVNSMSEQQSSLVNAIVQSMQLKSKPVKEEVQYDVVLDHNLKNEEIAEPSPEQEETDVVVVEENTVFSEASEDAEPIVTEQEAEEVAATPLPTPTPTPAPANAKTGLNISNQRTIEKEAGKAYASDEYSMLTVGQCGFFDAFSSKQVMERPIVCVNKIYTGDQAIRIIKEKIKGQDNYSYFDAPDGYTWNVIQYDLSYINCESIPYTNIRLVGVDGNELRFRGIIVDSRTHDANNFTSSEDDCVYNCYCYYAVPNGCHEYALSFGDGKAGDNRGLAIAYYYMTV